MTQFRELPTVVGRLVEKVKEMHLLLESVFTNGKLRTGTPIVAVGAGAPTFTAQEGTMYWDSTNNQMYVNNNSATGWTALN